MSDSFWIILTLVLMLVGLALSIVPLLPGSLLIWGIGVTFAYLNDFERVPLLAAGLIILLMIAGSTSGYWMQGVGARSEGGSCLTTTGGIIGALVGTFAIPIPILGTILGLVGGTLLVEFIRLGELEQAMAAGRRALKMHLYSMGIELACSAAIILVFIASVLLTR